MGFVDPSRIGSATPRGPRIQTPNIGAGLIAGSTSRDRGAPERLSINNAVPGMIQFAAETPVRSLETPVAIADRLGQAVTGASFVDQAAKFFDKTIVGDVSRGLESLVNYPGALGGSGFRQQLIDARGKSLDAKVTPYLVDILGNLAFGDHSLNAPIQTVGDLYAEARKRGYTDAEIAQLQSGEKGIFDFGEKMLTTDPLGNIALNVAFDPLTYFAGVGLLKSGVRAGAGAAARFAGSPVLEGFGVLEKAKGAGLYADKAIRASESVAAIAKGDLRGLTNKGMGLYLTQAARTYAKVGVRTYLGLEATTAAAGAAADATKDTPVAGFFENLHEIGMSLLDRRPISRNAFASLVAATYTPVIPLGMEAVKKVKSEWRSAVGDGTFEYFRKQLGPVAAGKMNSTHLARLFDHIDAKIVMERFGNTIENSVGNIAEASVRLKALNEVVRTFVSDARKNGTITNEQRWKKFTEWAGELGGFAEKSKVRMAFDPVLAAEQWPRYLEAIAPMQRGFYEYGKTIGYSDILTTANLSDIRAIVSAKAKGGTVGIGDVRRIMALYPQIMSGPRYRDWEKYGLASASDVSVKELTRKLDRLDEWAVESSLGHELDAAERGMEMDEQPVGQSRMDLRPELRSFIDELYGNMPEVEREAFADVFETMLYSLEGASPLDWFRRFKADPTLMPSEGDLLQIGKRLKVTALEKVTSIVAEIEPGIIQEATGQTALTRLNRMVNLDMKKYRPQKGKVLKEPHRWTTKDGRNVVFYTGPITAQKWREMVESTMTKEEIIAASKWYEDFRAAIGQAFGTDSEKVLMAFAATQSGQGVAAGMRIAVQSYRDFVTGKKSESLTTTEIQRAVDMALDGKRPTYKDAPKLSDFFDSFLRKVFRSYVGNDARGLRPAAIDRHTIRDLGFIDPATRDRVFRLTGGEYKRVKAMVQKRENNKIVRDEAGNPVMVPGFVQVPVKGTGVWLDLDMKSNGSFGKTTYDYGVRQMNDFTDELNAEGWMGKTDWIPSEIQAIGWYRVQLALGMSPDDLSAALDPVSPARLSFDLGITDERPLGQKLPNVSELPGPAREAITKGYAEWFSKNALPKVGAGIRLIRYGRGRWETDAPPFAGHLYLITPAVITKTGRKIKAVVRGVEKEVDEVSVENPAAKAAAQLMVLLPEQWAVVMRLSLKGLSKADEESAAASATARAMVIRGAPDLDEVWDRIHALHPTVIRGASEFDEVGGTILEIIVINEKGTNRVLLDDAMLKSVQEELAKIESPTRIELHHEPAHAELVEHDWGVEPDGRSVRDLLRGDGGTQGPEWVDDLKRASDQELARLVREHAPDEYATHRRERGLPEDFFQRAEDEHGTVKGLTRRNPDGTISQRGFDGADFSTAVHELFHGFFLLSGEDIQRTLLQYGDAEQLARWFERWMREGKSPVAGLDGVFAKAKQWMTNIYRRLRGTPLEKPIHPEVRAYFEDTIRRGYEAKAQATAPIRQALDGADNAAARLDADVAEELGPLYWHKSLQDTDQSVLDDLAANQRYLQENFPGYTIKTAPKIATLIDPVNGLEAQALTQYTTLGNWLYGSNIFSPMTRMIAWALRPVDGEKNAQSARQAMYSELATYGAKPDDVAKMLAALSEDTQRLVVGSNKVRIFRDYTHLPAGTINDAASRVFSKKVYDAVMADGGFANVLDQASNRFIRTLLDKDDKLSTIMERMYGRYQKSTAGKALRYTKVFYHIIRFLADPRWWAMNLLEADTIGFLRYGTKATFLNGQYVSPQMATQMTGHPITEKRLAGIAAELNGDVDNTFLLHRNLAGRVSGAFDTQRMGNAEKVVQGVLEDAMDEVVEKGLTAITDVPMIRSLVDQFGGDTSTWAAQLDEQLYAFDTKGVKQTLKDATAELNWDAETATRLAPVMARIEDLNSKLLDDIKTAFMGNAKRNNLERILNSYWLYWPLSYQLKAGKWLADVLTSGAVGKKSNFFGVWTYNKYREQHIERMENDPEYADMFKQYPSLWFAAQMLFPIYPEDLGVSLSRPVRYMGGEVGLWPEYKQAQDPLAAASAVLEIGPFYTLKLLRRIRSEVVREDATPYSYTGSQQGDFFTPLFPGRTSGQ